MVPPSRNRSPWLATALPQSTLGPEERARALAARQAAKLKQTRRQAAASQRARVRLAPITQGGAVEETTVLTRAQLAPEELRTDQEALRRLARSNLLDGTGLWTRRQEPRAARTGRR